MHKSTFHLYANTHSKKSGKKLLMRGQFEQAMRQLLCIYFVLNQATVLFLLFFADSSV